MCVILLQVRHRFGLYDEISEVLPGRRLRQCNWIRFLRYSLVASEEVNVVVTKPNPATGEAVFELVKDVGPKTELVAFFVPERPAAATEELNPLLLPAIHYLRQTLFKRILDNVLEESPLGKMSRTNAMSKSYLKSARHWFEEIATRFCYVCKNFTFSLLQTYLTPW